MTTPTGETQNSNEGAPLPFRVALAQINPTVGDIKGNTRLIIDHITRAREAQADLVAFPELCVTGYPPEDLLYKDSFLEAAQQALWEIVESTAGITAVVGITHSPHSGESRNPSGLPSVRPSTGGGGARPPPAGVKIWGGRRGIGGWGGGGG
ncbi:MAG: hypothetical protein F4X20_00950, partial [Dehalococcoidia bacterium]|nr:hypothetical protein [Dehalococcoidia bacterium]